MKTKYRAGHITVLVAVSLPVILALAGLSIDASRLLVEHRIAQQVCDAAATAAAFKLRSGGNLAALEQTVDDVVGTENSLNSATTRIYSPPISGQYVGSAQHVEVTMERTIPLVLMPIVGFGNQSNITVRAVSGFEPSPEKAAIVVLREEPPVLSIAGLPPLIAGLPALLAGFEILGVGELVVQGAVHVNTSWRGWNEVGEIIGEPAPLLSHAVSCTPILGISRLRTPELRVVGGVDNPAFYRTVAATGTSPIKANRLKVPDPFASLGPPTLGNDAGNVHADNYGGVTIAVALPILAPPVHLSPGVYDWINIGLGHVVFDPGIYIIRSQHPVTGHALLISGLARVEADGVLFYLTNFQNYDVNTGSPGHINPPFLGTLRPSAVINLGLLGTRIRGLNDPSSPYDGLAIYQAKDDPQPIVIVQESLIGSGNIDGVVYAPSAHLILAGIGEVNMTAVVGTMRCVNLLSLKIVPSRKVAAASDVYLVE